VELRASVFERPAGDEAGGRHDGRQDFLVRALKELVIPRLARAHLTGQPIECMLATPLAHDVESFAAWIVAGNEAAIAKMLERLRRSGATPDVIYLDLLAPVARYLGKLWDDDLCDFAIVTLGVARLQRLVRELGPTLALGETVQGPVRTLLLAQAPEDQHSLGLAMVGEFFRRDGWQVDQCPREPGIDPAARTQRQWFDAVGFSMGLESSLPWLRTQISAVRLASRNAGVLVLLGGPLFVQQQEVAADLAANLGADLWVKDAREAPALVAQRLRMPVELQA